MNVIAGTPLWVYPLFAVLLAFSIWQSQGRTVNMIQLAILPLLFLITSTARLAQVDQILSLLYLCTLLFISCLLVYFRSRKRVHVSATLGKIELSKDWIRGAGIMLIFFCQYYLAARQAILGEGIPLGEHSILAVILALSTSPLLSTAIAAWGLKRSL
ncbi:hypothetical protein [Pseudoteredinibacter isoporae]|uniref:Uncharacterized protein n=1 Tax=Pseudoteredinibacter isoporae TaxID=570281 RepID=A0A7X0JU61_9GAMM|nr:hypothetical protein [Pseudoteredinibacter isoporae]MBB6521768.1 hypothetical protein [Pseudoteredinibacter isoporae]NHO87315.1 hypothetical protein [Pseudoteredinibacter isoporae]NIB23053.1 hypothetical protein [Pseudoteredinibacter isoporae]